jgi:hypothetical protein
MTDNARNYLDSRDFGGFPPVARVNKVCGNYT